MEFIDTHAHIYVEDFKEDLAQVISDSKATGLRRIYMPNIDVDSIDAMMDVHRQYPDFCIPMMGLHPTDVKEDFESQLAIMYEWLKKFPFAAVGEIGTDLYWDKTALDRQIEALKIQIGWAKEFDLPIAIHCRDSFKETVAVVEELQDGNLKGVFHCFSGSVEDAERAIAAGMMLGIGGVSTFKNGGMDKLLPHLTCEHLLLETDAPYLAPVPHRGKRNQPHYVSLVAQRIADLQQISVVEVAKITTQNALNLFKG
ncbi:TatD family hydrolase [Persicobacter psychrovividus]|uniref:TatD family hydrolase n=1 Tax=Persicobacter psychrovividus TaxID=387638 RepID=A0ABN6LE69_9BACT|nr:TatD family hydrolase [Persicobacter psychrovividus]